MMQAARPPIQQDLVLVGGGHSHAIALRLLRMQQLLPEGTRVTLISDVSHAPYSGMLPGFVAGYYSYDETHIDLQRLAACVGARFYLDRVVGLDLDRQSVICQRHPPVCFDYLSLDIGSTPGAGAVPGADAYAVAAKPVPEFLRVWRQLLATAEAHPEKSLRLAIVGGGAGGVELALNAHRRLRAAGNRPDIHLLHAGDRLLPGHARSVGRQLQKLAIARDLQVYLQARVARVTPGSLILESGRQLTGYDSIVWVTQASAPKWLQAAGLDVDAAGFVLVDRTLRSRSHPRVFAAGDIATMQHHPRPKAGVFAVRQGPPLARNLGLVLRGKDPQPFVPQRQVLGLIGTGDKQAIASWGPFGLRAGWLWRWKDRIDRDFMAQFEQLQPMTGEPEATDAPPIPCAGCGAKLGGSTLSRTLRRLAVEFPRAASPTAAAGITVGLEAPDDAAVLVPPAGKLLVQSTDYFRSPLSDPFIFGQIAANHCLSDLYAMGATPHSALAIATLPYATPAKSEETLYQLLAGAIKVLQANDAALIGGHTTTAPELAMGLAVNGWVAAEDVLRKGGALATQALLLNKPLGTGTLLAALMRGRAKGRWLETAVEIMLQSNRAAADIFREYGATALTDVTGFGLLGHLLELVEASDVGAELELEALPALPGALTTLQQGVASSLSPENTTAAANSIEGAEAVSQSPLYALLFDPQTSGGLLASVPWEQAAACAGALQAAGYPYSCQIGTVTVRDRPAPIILRRP